MSKKSARKKLPSIFIAIVIGTIASIVSLVGIQYFFQIAYPAVGQAFDTSWPTSVYLLRTPFATQLMSFITLFGADMTILLAGVAVILFQQLHLRRESHIFITAIIFGLFLNQFLKLVFARMRPDMAPLIFMDSYSYPSGHAMNAFIFYGLLAYYVIVFTKREILEVAIAVFSVIMILLVGFSRIYLGVHYPTDVLAGYMAGLCVVAAAIYINNLYLKR